MPKSDETIGMTVEAGDRGVPALVKDSNGLYNTLTTDANGKLLVASSGGAAGEQYTDGDVTIAHPIGTIPVFDNAGTITAVSATNPLPVLASVSTTGLATDSNQTDGSQKTQVVDGSGNVIGATSNALDINIKSGNPTTITATQGTASNLKSQAECYMGGAAVAVGNPLEVTLPATTVITLTPPAAITGFATSAKQLADGHNVVVSSGAVTVSQGTAANCKVEATIAATQTLSTVTTVSTLTDQTKMNGQTISMGTGTRDAGTQRVTIATNDAVPVTFTGSTDVATQTTLAAINTKLVSGTDIGDVTINNSTGAAAVNIQDGGNTITVDGTVTANATLAAETTKVIGVTRSADGSGNLLTSTGNALDINIKTGNPTTMPVTNTGTFAVQAEPTIKTGYGRAFVDNADTTTARALTGAEAQANNYFYITSIILSAAAAGAYWIEDDDAAQITCKWTLAANGGVSWTAGLGTPYKSKTVNKGLKVKGSVAGVVGCMITFYAAT